MDQRAVLATICQLLPVKSFPQSGQVMKKLVLATAAAVACSSAWKFDAATKSFIGADDWPFADTSLSSPSVFWGTPVGTGRVARQSQKLLRSRHSTAVTEHHDTNAFVFVYLLWLLAA
jgi:hypothetical protein